MRSSREPTPGARQTHSSCILKPGCLRLLPARGYVRPHCTPNNRPAQLAPLCEQSRALLRPQLRPCRLLASAASRDLSAAESATECSTWRPLSCLSVGLLAAFLTVLCRDAIGSLLGGPAAMQGLTYLGFTNLFKRPSWQRLQWRLPSLSSTEEVIHHSNSEGSKDQNGDGEKKPDQISIESIENEQPAAAAAALTELGNVQTPASVWLPYRDTNTNRNMLRAQIGPAVITIGGRLGRALLIFLRMPRHLLSLLSFKSQQIMLASTGTKLIAVFIAGIPMCLVGGLVYSWTSGKTVMDGMINAYGALYKIPGVLVIGEINASTAHVMNILWLIGTFTFAIVLGVVTEDIVNTVISIRSGNYPVVATNHTLILNWNSQTISLLRQIAINKLERANGAYDGPVVILADRDKEKMDEELRTALKGYCTLEWHTRMGFPHSISDLQRVAAGQAKTVILLNPEGEEDVGKKQVAAILGVQSARAMTKPRPFLRLLPQNIAVQVPENAEDRGLIAYARDIMAASAQWFKLTYLSCKRDMSTLLALSAIQPGVASVYCTIVQQTQRGVEFYLKRFPEFSGRTFGEARRAFDDAVLCGYVRENPAGQPDMHVNCRDSDVLEDGDRVIALSQTGRFRPAQRSEKKEKARQTGSDLVTLVAGESQGDPLLGKPKHLVVLWLEAERISDLLLSLAAFGPDGSSVTVVSRSKPEDFPEERRIGHTTFEFLEGDPAQMDLLAKAGVPFSDAVIIGGVLEQRPAKEADALTMALIMLVQECVGASGRESGSPTHIVGMVRRPDSVEVANYLMERLGKGSTTAELIHPDELVSGIISQVAAEPDMAALFAGFVYSSEGSEIYLRRPVRYRLPEDREISFAQISEMCRLRNEIAIGYIGTNGDVRMAPKATSVRKYSSTDRVLVIAES